MNKLQEILKEFEEFADLHAGDCDVMSEDGGECDCDMSGVKPFLAKSLEEYGAALIEEVKKEITNTKVKDDTQFNPMLFKTEIYNLACQNIWDRLSQISPKEELKSE